MMFASYVRRTDGMEPIVVHHLNHSRSTRVLWLLEELGLPYEIRRYERLPGFRAPDELKLIHPLGRAPVVEFGKFVVSESAVILKLIDLEFGGARFTPERGSPEWLRVEEWLAFAEGGLAQPIMTTLYGKLAGGLSGVLAAIVERDAHQALHFTAASLATRQFLVGDTLTLADIQACYLLDLAGYVGLLAEWEPIRDYLAGLKVRPALQRALEVGGSMIPAS